VINSYLSKIKDVVGISDTSDMAIEDVDYSHVQMWMMSAVGPLLITQVLPGDSNRINEIKSDHKRQLIATLHVTQLK